MAGWPPDGLDNDNDNDNGDDTDSGATVTSALLMSSINVLRKGRHERKRKQAAPPLGPPALSSGSGKSQGARGSKPFAFKSTHRDVYALDSIR